MKHSFHAFSLLLLALVALLAVFLTSCEPKEDVVTADPGAVLTASVEMVKFDTVFTSLGSITKRFWVYNRNARAVKVDEISLVGAASTVARFKLIINGRDTTVLRDFELRGKDSVLVLAKVTIDPNQLDTAFVVMDSVRLRANGTTRYVRLRAFGENARYYDALPGFVVRIECDTTWTPRLPIVLLGTARVDSSCVLTIEPGTRVYLAPGASLEVLGRLRCGALDGPAVKFRGLRRDDFFDTTDPRYPPDDYSDDFKYGNTPGQWGWVVFVPSLGREATQENELLNTDLRNSTIGVIVSNRRFRRGHRVRIENCFIRNAYAAGVYGEAAGFGDGGVELLNTVITRCGERAVLGIGGGNWHLAHCTVEMGGALFLRRETEALAFKNAIALGSGVRAEKTTLTIENSIVWSGLSDDEGNLQNEILLLREGSNKDSLYTFRHNLLQTRFARFNTDGQTYGRNESGTNVLNEDPRFRNAGARIQSVKQDLRLDSLASPARRLGEPLSPPVPLDLIRTARNPTQPSAGAYESVP
ncbi:MAG: hypothetical protein H7330_16835 [Hymenobacteraceae bacterium]|nr:hypothetical protein [Hymenobacteraceae bacterium]